MPQARGHHDNGSTATPPVAPQAPAARTIAEVVDTIVSRFDANSDGAITSAEVLAVVDPSGTRTTVQQSVASAFTAVDTNQDGSLSKAELTTAVTALDTNGSGTLDRADHPAAGTGTPDPLMVLLGGPHGHGGPGGEPPALTVGALVSGAFTRFDADLNTTIALSELLAVLDPKAAHPTFDTALGTLFKQLDTNGDSGLSQAELTTALGAVDTDASGTLDHAELDAAHGTGGGVDLVGVLLHGHDGPGHELLG